MVDLATKTFKDVLKLKLPDPNDKSYARLLQLKLAAAQGIMTTATRVQSALLRPVAADEMDEVLAAMKAVRADDLMPTIDDEDVDIFG